ncbi:MAG: protein kinase [Candidatus Schekmanbacteria bacterium]|nr:protein kinase [Candidatus Schekmanbacteria bacterium]
MTRIMIVEDEENLQRFYQVCLGKEGYDVETFGTWADARNRLLADPPDLLLLDIGLPDMDGIEALKELRGIEPDLPVMMITAYGTKDRVQQAMRYGIRDFIVKPPRTSVLRERVRKVLGGTSPPATEAPKRSLQELFTGTRPEVIAAVSTMRTEQIDIGEPAAPVRQPRVSAPIPAPAQVAGGSEVGGMHPALPETRPPEKPAPAALPPLAGGGEVGGGHPAQPEAEPREKPVPSLPPAQAVQTPQAPQAASSANYELIRRIARGGMAELFLAKKRGLEDFQRLVAIKRMLPHLTDDEEFVTMFLDECRLVSRLQHPNIVQVFDIGKMGQSYFLAMEYVQGHDLHALVNRVAQGGGRIPYPLTLFICSEIACGLSYAHQLRDEDGRHFAIIHRDINPKNVLVSLAGEVKIVDFGIAKAASRSRETDTGIITGKVAYMSPEQAVGKVLDGRSDLFSLGIVLFEMLTGRHLFARENNLATLEAVRRAEVPTPSSLVEGLPPSIDAVVRRCLAPRREDRYADGAELQMALLELIQELGRPVTRSDLAGFLKTLNQENAGRA